MNVRDDEFAKKHDVTKMSRKHTSSDFCNKFLHKKFLSVYECVWRIAETNNMKKRTHQNENALN